MKIVVFACSITNLLTITQWLVPVVSDEIVYQKPASQSGTFSDFAASLAVDGDETTCCIACSTCGGFTPSGILAWILIDLRSFYTVYNVTLVNTNRTEDRRYMENFTINIANSSTSDVTQDFGSLCYYYNSSSFVSTRMTVSCRDPLYGRYVIFRRVGGYRSDALSVCEAYVYGYPGPRIIIATTTTSSSSPSSSSSSSTPTRTTTTTTPNREWSRPTSTIVNSTIFFSSSRSPDVTVVDSDAAAKSSAIQPQILAVIIGVTVGVVVVIIGLIILFICIKTNRCGHYRRSTSLCRRQSQKPIMFEDSSSIYAATSCLSDTPGRLIGKLLLSSYVAELRATPNGFLREFKKLPDENAAEAKLGQQPDNRLKNRFTNVLPYDHTIVPLDVEEFDDDTSSYINANFIAGYKKTAQAYIAAQGPRPNTIDDFWRMIWQKKTNVIVMLTELIEKTKNKCELYWPERLDETKRYNKIYVTLVSEDFYADYVERQMIIHDERQEHESPRTVRQLQCLCWLDNSRPQQCFQLLSFRRKVQKLREDGTGPVVVHCSSGIGRTGAFIALDYLLDQVTSEDSLSVFGCVEELRRQRMNMVQTQDQYEFVYDALIEEVEIGDTSKSCEEFVEYYTNSNTNSTFQRQLEQLRKMSQPKVGRKSAGLDSENLAKNRNNAIVAYDDSRTYLDISYVGRSDYVNAVSVSSYSSAHAHILTQVPLRDTIVDFWRLMWDYDLKTIVLLDDLTETDQKYWTESSGSRTYGPFLVEMVFSEQESQNVRRRQFILTNTKDKQRESLCVNQFEVRNWLNGGTSLCSEDVEKLFELRKHLADHLELQPTNERIVMQCMDGSTKSGLFAASLHVIDRILTETRVDVCLSCRYIRIHRPTSIDSMDHFLFLHEVAAACCRQMDPGAGGGGGQGLRLKRLSFSTLYASERNLAPNAER